MAGLALWAAMAGTSWAQDSQVWVQLEALPTLDRAELAAQGYSDQLPDVEGFYLGSGWYAVALGPYTSEEAEAVLANLRAEGVIPGDALLADGGEPSMCGWLKDRFGLSWQIVPEELDALLGDPDPERARRAMEVMLTQRRIDIAEIRRAVD